MTKMENFLNSIVYNLHEDILIQEANRSEILQALKDKREGKNKIKESGMKVLKIAEPNAKIDHYSLSLPSGYTCCGADECLSYAGRTTGSKIRDGKNTKYRCFAATDEHRFKKNVGEPRWNNFDLIKNTIKDFGVDAAAELINTSIENSPASVDAVFRIHVGGDFFSQEYFDAWVKVANMNPDRIYYTYTKSIPFWIKRLGSIPDNFQLNASLGGKYDDMVEEYGLKTAKVVFSVEEAESLGLEIDTNDDLAWSQDESFALLLHGQQPKDSEARDALGKLRKSGIKGYSRD